MTRRSLALTLVMCAVAVACVTAGEESPQEQSLKQTMRVLDQLTMTLATIKDADTAQAARPQLQKSAKEWLAVKAKAAELPPPDQTEKDRLTKEYKGKLELAMKKFFVETGRVRGFPAGRAVLDELKDIKDFKQPVVVP